MPRILKEKILKSLFMKKMSFVDTTIVPDVYEENRELIELLKDDLSIKILTKTGT